MKNYIRINAMIPIDDTEYNSKSIKIRNLLEELSIDNTGKMINIEPYHKYTGTPDGRYYIGDIFAEKHNNNTKFYLITGIDKIKTNKNNSFNEIPTDFHYSLYCLECVTLEQIKKDNDYLINRKGDVCISSFNATRFIKLDNFDLYVNTNAICNHKYSSDLIQGHFYPGFGNATEDGYIFRNLGNCGEEILNKVIKMNVRG